MFQRPGPEFPPRLTERFSIMQDQALYTLTSPRHPAQCAKHSVPSLKPPINPFSQTSSKSPQTSSKSPQTSSKSLPLNPPVNPSIPAEEKALWRAGGYCEWSISMLWDQLAAVAVAGACALAAIPMGMARGTWHISQSWQRTAMGHVRYIIQQ